MKYHEYVTWNKRLKLPRKMYNVYLEICSDNYRLDQVAMDIKAGNQGLRKISQICIKLK